MNVEIYDQLKEFGIERKLAEEAAKRYGSMEAAVDWCFGPGANWTPDEELPSYNSSDAGGQSGHYENSTSVHRPPDVPQQGLQPASGSLPAVASPRSNALASNNPFKSSPSMQDHTTFDQHDEDLQRALRLSQEHSASSTPVGESEEDTRTDRERSIRATAPPPSPSPDDMPPLEPLYGPSNKTEDGSTALVTLPSQDSLMTASFHSASAYQAMEKPKPGPRQPGAPLVLLSQTGEMTFAALFLQAMMAVPQIREIVEHAPLVTSSTESAQKVQASLRAFASEMQSGSDAFVDADELLCKLTYRTSQLPPDRPTRDLLEKFEYQISIHWLASLLTEPLGDEVRQRGGWWADPDRLFKSVIHQPANVASYVTFRRANRLPNDLYAHLADILWARDALPSSIKRLAEVLAVFIAWDSNAKREIWKLEERVVLDRFMKDQEMWAAQVRAEQGVAGGNARRLKEEIERLTYRNGSNFQDGLAALIKHYEAHPPTGDPVQTTTQGEMKAKLGSILSSLRTKADALQVEMDGELERSNGLLFRTDDPDRNKHVYLLRAVLFHDGSLIGGRHLYGYFRGEDASWWRVQDHEISPVQWKDVESDSTGIYMEGGPYQLIYSREGPTPPSGASTPTTSASDTQVVTKEIDTPGETEEDLIKLDSGAAEAPANAEPVERSSDNLIVLD